MSNNYDIDRLTSVNKLLLKNQKFNVKLKDGSIIYESPDVITRELIKNTDFSFDMLSIGGDIPLSELAVHVDEQAALEAHFTAQCEMLRYAKEVAENQFSVWMATAKAKARSKLSEESKKAPTEASIDEFVKSREPLKSSYVKHQYEVTLREFQYRLLMAAKDVIKRKGDLLPTLRNIIQGTKEGIQLQQEIANRTREKLNIGAKK